MVSWDTSPATRPDAPSLFPRSAATPKRPFRRLLDFTRGADLRGWRSIDDTLMGGTSQGSASPGDGGTLVFKGHVSLDNDGGFSSVRMTGRRFDLSRDAGLALLVRGDGKRHAATLSDGPGWASPGFKATFPTVADEWTVVQLAWDDFERVRAGRLVTPLEPLDRQAITAIGLLISDRQAGPFRLEVAWIGAW